LFISENNVIAAAPFISTPALLFISITPFYFLDKSAKKSFLRSEE
jgi:hypothetical protein